MIGGVTRRTLTHLSGVPHLHVNRPLILHYYLHDFDELLAFIGWLKVRFCGMRSSFEWYVLNIKMFEKKNVGEAGKW